LGNEYKEAKLDIDWVFISGYLFEIIYFLRLVLFIFSSNSSKISFIVNFKYFLLRFTLNLSTEKKLSIFYGWKQKNVFV
jgi:hypothetical protein